MFMMSRVYLKVTWFLLEVQFFKLLNCYSSTNHGGKESQVKERSLELRVSRAILVELGLDGIY